MKETRMELSRCWWMLAAIALVARWEAMGETNNNEAARWLEAVELAPPLRVPDDQPQWARQRIQHRDQLWRLLGKLPARVGVPEVRTRTREDRGGYVVEKFEFENGAGATVPGYFVVPKGRERGPAILWCHWHGGQYENGKEEIFGSEHTPEEPALALTKRGYAVLAIDAYGFGERNGKGPGGEKGGAGEMTASKFNLWAGRTLWGMMLRDDLMALDYLVSRPEVDPERVGVTGISMGATRTWWLMALDERLRAGVAVACLTRYQDLILEGGLKYHGIYYYVPGMLNYFDTEAVVALSAPRALLFLTGDQDLGSPVEGVRKIEAAVRPAYRLYGRDGAFQSVIYPGVGHVYLPDMWRRMLDWMEHSLQ